eukprot:3798787-Prymnesium_polylepis.2
MRDTAPRSGLLRRTCRPLCTLVAVYAPGDTWRDLPRTGTAGCPMSVVVGSSGSHAPYHILGAHAFRNPNPEASACM